MHKPGESVVSIAAGGAAGWLHVFLVFGSIACACFVLGAVIGLLLRRRPHIQMPVGIVVSLVAYTLLEWRFAVPGEWSWQHPIASAAYQIAPVALFFVAPTLVGVAIVHHLCSRHAHSI